MGDNMVCPTCHAVNIEAADGDMVPADRELLEALEAVDWVEVAAGVSCAFSEGFTTQTKMEEVLRACKEAMALVSKVKGG